MLNQYNTEVTIQKNGSLQTLNYSTEAKTKTKANQIILEKFDINAVKNIKTVKTY